LEIALKCYEVCRVKEIEGGSVALVMSQIADRGCEL
jgi:hypothetical protein